MMKTRFRPAAQIRRISFDRVFGGVATLALHEADAARGHVNELGERLRVARRARGVGELLRDQLDLFPESRNRLQRDHDVRRRLWRGLIRDLSQPPQAPLDQAA